MRSRRQCHLDLRWRSDTVRFREVALIYGEAEATSGIDVEERFADWDVAEGLHEGQDGGERAGLHRHPSARF